MKRQKLINDEYLSSTKTKSKYGLLTHEILNYLICNTFIDDDCVRIIHLVCKSLKIYTWYVKSKISMSESKPDFNFAFDFDPNPIKTIVTIIQNITHEDILDGNAQITNITKVGKGGTNSTLCSVYANSLYDIILNELNNKFEINNKKCVITSVNCEMSQLRDFIEANDNNNMSYIYTFYMFHRDLLEQQSNSESSSNSDSDMQKVGNFPGHCFGLIKMANTCNKEQKYVLTQTFQNIYTHKEHIDVLNLQDALNICDMFAHICENDIINEQFIKYWKAITHIDDFLVDMKGCGIRYQNENKKSFAYYTKFIY